MRALDADEVIDYRAVDFTRVVENVDVVLELVGQAEYGARSIQVLRPGASSAST